MKVPDSPRSGESIPRILALRFPFMDYNETAGNVRRPSAERTGKEAKGMGFGSYLKKARTSAGLTQEEAARKIGVSAKTLQKWEYDEVRFPQPEAWRGITKAYGLSENDFLLNLRVVMGDEEEQSEFPDELFRAEDLKVLKGLKLTRNEQEILGLEEIYVRTYGKAEVPYEPIGRMGTYEFLSSRKSLLEKIGRFGNFVMETTRDDPLHEPFDANRLGPERIRILLEDLGCGGVGWELLKALKVVADAGGVMKTKLKDGARGFPNRIPTPEEEALFAKRELLPEEFTFETALEWRWVLKWPRHMKIDADGVSMTEKGRAFWERNAKYAE